MLTGNLQQVRLVVDLMSAAYMGNINIKRHEKD